MTKYSNNGQFDSGRWIRDFKLKEILKEGPGINDPALKALRIHKKGTPMPPLDRWWEYEPSDIMTAAYWSKGQLPPRDKATYEKEWANIVKQLHSLYPIPASVLPKLDMDAETERAISVDAPDMNEIAPGHYTESDIDLGPNHTFEPGNMWSNDFDYVGMLKYGAQATLSLGQDMLNDLYDSFTDVNYHTEAQDLGNAIDWMAEDMERAQQLMESFNKACMKTLKEWKIKWSPK